MVYAVWGTGRISTRLATQYTVDISFFIDNDVNKKGKLFCGKRIFHPDEIKGWNDIHIIVAMQSIELIEEQLKRYGLQSGRDYSMYYDNILVDFRSVDKEIDEIVYKIQCTDLQDSIIYFGPAFKDERGNGFMNTYFNQWKKVCVNKNFLFLFETEDAVKADNYMEEKAWMLPSFFWRYKYCSSASIDIEDEIIHYVEGDKKLKSIAKMLRKRNNKAQPFYEHGEVYYLYLFISKVIDAVCPKCIIIWNQFTTYHLVAEYVCTLKNIPVIFAEHGVLPGTLAFELMGQMGESAPTVYAEEFLELPVSTAEYKRAGDIWAYIKNNNLNRKMQMSGRDLEQIKLKLDLSKPVVFYAGQYDAGAGMDPYTEKSREFHSPMFESAIEAAKYLAEIADKNNWNIVFKPHPYSYVSQEEKEALGSNIIWAERNVGVNYLVDLSDVTVTIVSQTAYIALLRDKPALLLGYIQLKDKRCTYQAFEKIRIEGALTEAIERGFTAEQKNAFQKHIAQLVKYYLYDDYDEKRDYRYGKDYPRSFEEIEALEIRLKSMRGESQNDNG